MNSVGDEASWEFRVEKPGFFKAELTYATKDGTQETDLELRIGERVKRCTLRSSGGLEQFVSDAVTVAVPQSGKQSLKIRCRSGPPSDSLVLRNIRFIPIGANVTPSR